MQEVTFHTITYWTFRLVKYFQVKNNSVFLELTIRIKMLIVEIFCRLTSSILCKM